MHVDEDFTHLPRVKTKHKENSQEKKEKKEKERRKHKRRRREREERHNTNLRRPASNNSASSSNESLCEDKSDTSSVEGGRHRVEGLQILSRGEAERGGEKHARDLLRDEGGKRVGKSARHGSQPKVPEFVGPGSIATGGTPVRDTCGLPKRGSETDICLPAIGFARCPANINNAPPSQTHSKVSTHDIQPMNFATPPSKPSPLLPSITGKHDHEGRLIGGYTSDNGDSVLPKLKRGSHI